MRVPHPECCNDPRYLCSDCKRAARSHLHRNARYQVPDFDLDDEEDAFDVPELVGNAFGGIDGLVANSADDNLDMVPPTINFAELASPRLCARQWSQPLGNRRNHLDDDADDPELVGNAYADAVRNADMIPPAIACNWQDDHGLDAFTSGSSRLDRGLPHRRLECPNCGGTGQVGHEMDAFNKKMRCETCGGTGAVTLRRQEPVHDGSIPPIR